MYFRTIVGELAVVLQHLGQYLQLLATNMTLSTTVSSPPAVAPCFRSEELLRRQKQQRRQAEAKRKAEEQLQVQIRNPEQGVLVEVDD